MKIVDEYGVVIKITDLDGAIRQAELFRQFRHIGRRFSKLDERLCTYWTDMHDKLLILKGEVQP